MIPDPGPIFLTLALVAALTQTVLSLMGAVRRQTLLMRAGRTAAFIHCTGTLLAFATLTVLFINSDLSIRLVADHSHAAKPLFYKIAGVWGNHEGSMLLWTAILSVFAALMAAPSVSHLRAGALGIHGAVSSVFLTFILFASNPFTRLDPPAPQGLGLNPILQDPALAVHPPFLYAGYVGLSAGYAFALAGLLLRADPRQPARLIHSWTLAAWSALTIGIALGSWWAYHELGWGGFWFWDPVENASLMPWLTATALLHASAVSERNGGLYNWTTLLAIITFGLALIGTFLVRSGVLTSVHAFASDPTRGVFILAILFCVIGGGLALFALRAATRHGTENNDLFAPISRESAIILNNILLTGITATVFIGTLYPLALDALGMGRISVGTPFFVLTVAPLMIPLCLTLPTGPLLGWRRGDLTDAARQLTVAGGLAAMTAAAVWVVFDGGLTAVLGMGLAVWVIVGALTPAGRLRRRAPGTLSRIGMITAHAGVGIALIGIIASTSWREEKIEILSPGGAVEFAGLTITLRDVSEITGPNYLSLRSRLDVTRGRRAIATLHPEKRLYLANGTVTTETAVYPLLFADLHAVPGREHEEGRVFHFYRIPLVSLLWIGALVMSAGGVLALAGRRRQPGLSPP